MRLIVTGGAGFIGSTLVDMLCADGHEVTVIDDLRRGSRENLHPTARLIEMGVEEPGIAAVIHEVAPDAIFHLAAQIDVRSSVADPLADAQTNVMGTINLLNATCSAKVPKLVFASSGGAIYGDTEIVPTPETHGLLPASPYGAAKGSGELYGSAYSSMYGLAFTALRYANVYGPRQDPHGEAGVVAIFAQRMLERKSVVINGDGLQTRDYVYVEDVARANVAALTSAPGSYNIGTGVATSVRDIARGIAHATGYDAEPAFGPARPGEQRRSVLDISLARAALGWSPSIDLETGIALTCDWFAARART